MNIDNLRKEIDAIDEQLVVLLQQRLDTVQKIGIYKAHNGLAIRNHEREENVIKKALLEAKEDYHDYVTKFMAEVIEMSCHLQESMECKR